MEEKILKIMKEKYLNKDEEPLFIKATETDDEEDNLCYGLKIWKDKDFACTLFLICRGGGGEETCSLIECLGDIGLAFESWIDDYDMTIVGFEEV